MKVKNFILNIFDKVKDFLKKYPITIMTIFISTLLISIFENNLYKVSEKILILALTSSAGTFLIETFLNKKVFKIIGYVCALTIGIFFTFIIECEERVIIGYVLAIFLISIYGIVKKEKVIFRDYIAISFANIFSVSIIYSIVNMGVILLLLVFTELIIDCGFGNTFIKAEIIMLGMFYIPSILYSITSVKNSELNGFIKGLLKFVLFPLILTGMVIVYLYIAKIIILRKMPSNVIFRILSIMFIFAFPIWNMVESIGKDNKFISKTTKILPFLYIPFIILEGISIGIRILEYGVTPIRCIGLAGMIIQIIALIYNIIKKGKGLSKIFIYMAIIVFILLVTPFNYEQISLYSQKYILTKYMKENIDEISIEEKYKINGSYNYIITNYGKEYLPNNIDEEKIIEINIDDFYYGDYEVNYNDYRSIYFEEELTDIDISKYSKISATHIFNDGNNGEFNFYNFVNKIIKEDKKDENCEDYIRNNKIQKIDENTDLIITKVIVDYETQDNNIVYSDIRGYILKK